MVIYTGGRDQGKTELVRKHYTTFYREYRRGDYFRMVSELRNLLDKNGGADDGYILIDDFHLMVREMMDGVCELGDYRDMAEEMMGVLLDVNLRERLIIISNELGSGVIPVDRFLDTWREICGRCMIRLAAAADEVYLVNLGIATRIK